MTSKTVFTRKLRASHQTESFTEFLPLNGELVTEIRTAVKETLDAMSGKDFIKSSGDVYIKPNGIDAKPYCNTRSEVIRAVIEYWFDAGAKNVFLMESP